MAENQLATIKSAFEHDDVKKRFFDMLGKRSTSFIVSVIDVVSNSPQLSKADRNSILLASANAATLDLPVNPNLGFAYIVPYYDGKLKIYKAQFQMGYKGFIQLAQRSGQFSYINATKVVEGEIKNIDRLTGEMEFEWEQDQDARNEKKIVGFLGYFKLVNGFEKHLYMTIKELRAHGLKYSQSFKKGYGQWEDNFEAMAVKTVLKLLLSKYAPLSPEMQRAVLTDQAIIGDWEANQLDYADNKLPSLDEVQEEKEKNRIKKWIDDAQDEKKLAEVRQHVYDSEDDEIIDLYEQKLNDLGVDISA